MWDIGLISQPVDMSFYDVTIVINGHNHNGNQSGIPYFITFHDFPDRSTSPYSAMDMQIIH